MSSIQLDECVMAYTNTKEYVKKYSKDELNDLLEFWNSMDIIKHSPDTKEFKTFSDRIQRQDLDMGQIKEAILNYNTILNDESYYFNYKWKLSDFIGRSARDNKFTRFLPEGQHYVNYTSKLVKTVKRVKKVFELPSAKLLNLDKINELYDSLLAEFKSMDYQTYLKTKHWLGFKEKVLRNNGLKCQLCNTCDTVLSVHHNNYENRGRETFNDVIVLCGECHAKFHNK